MRKNLKYTLILVIALVLIACKGSDSSQDQEDRDGIKITGNVSGADGDKVSMWVFEKDGDRKVDSAIVENGSFTLWTDTEELRQYVIQVGKGSQELIYIFPDENSDEIKIEGGVPGLYRNYTITGDQNSMDYLDYWKYILPYLDKEKVLYQQYEQTNPADTVSRNQIMAELDSLHLIERDYAINYIENNPSSPAAWIMLQEFYPPGGLTDFDSTDLDYFDLVAKEMSAKYPYSDYPELIESNKESILSQMNQVEQADTEAGMAPDLNFPNPDGENIALSSLRGKVVLLDFWASWCGPCRMENPNVVKMYDKYKDKGFTVYSVSLDNKKDDWVKAIEADNLKWPNHVSDLKGWQSEAAALYNVSSIPATFLLDENGKIIEQNLRGAQLEQKLQEILN